MAPRSAASTRRQEAARSRDGDSPNGTPGAAEHPGAAQAAKAAVAAAFVGAAVGAARALATRRSAQDDEDREEHSEPAAETPEPDSAEPDQREEASAGDGGEEPVDETQHEESAADDGREDAVDETHEPESAEREQVEESPPADDDGGDDDGDERPRAGVPTGDLERIVARARQQLQALQGHEAESVSSLERTPDGWLVALEVLELRRIPESTDLMATYELELDDDANVRRYARRRRYHRAQADSREGQ